MSMTDEQLRELLYEWRDDGSITELIDEVIDLNGALKHTRHIAADNAKRWAEERDKVVRLREAVVIAREAFRRIFNARRTPTIVTMGEVTLLALTVALEVTEDK